MRAECPESDDALFELRFAPSVALVSTVRRFVSDFYDELLKDRDASHRLGMATHEMLENAVHYSSDHRSELVVSLHRVNGQFLVTIRTTNRATDERLSKVRRALDEVVTAPDPMDLYNQLVRRAAKRTDGGSGLGLGRIRAEADLALSYSIEGDTLVLTAEGRFPPRPEPQLTESR
ncbi:MAG: ATP-binding protein [Labilithrix sp.]|nr:ATP-binding protein [Labilithrix sp.]